MAPDPYKYFRVEARELLDALNQGVLDLEKGAAPQEAAARLLRHAHTLKGAARVVRLAPIADLAHAMEEALTPLREGGKPPKGLADRLLAVLDGMAGHLAALDSPVPVAAASPEPGAPAPLPAPDRRLETVRLEVAELDGVLEGLREASGRLSLLRAQASGLDQARRLAQGLASQAGAEPRWRATAQELEGRLERFDRQALAGLEQAERELGLAQEKAARLRLLPAAVLFDFLERTCRDAASALGKSVHFESVGGEQRLDSPVLSALQEALQHVVRNAVAHGIEDPAGRKAAGKAAQGCVRLSVRRRSGRIHILCSDDGRGLDMAAVRRTAVERGLLPKSAPDPLPQDQALALLLKGGLSTSAQVTELSGRGLGLDVLRAAAERLKGELQVRSQPGKGMEVELAVPASLSTFPALAVECDGVASLIPFDAVLSAHSLRPQDLARSPEGETLLVEGQVLPFMPLGACLGLAVPGRQRAGLVLQGAGAVAALGVDRILGVREAVVLPLPELAPDQELAAGACLDQAGDPCLLLDPEALVRAAQARRAPGSAEPERSRLPLLVIDDSLTTRMLEQSILETAGYSVELAVSAEEGLLKARERRYGLILVDVEMPGMSGFEFLEQLRNDPSLREIPAILVSSRASAEDLRRGQAAGARDYITKGEFDQARLLNRIRELLA